MTIRFRWKVGTPIVRRIRINFSEEFKKEAYRRVNRMLSH